MKPFIKDRSDNPGNKTHTRAGARGGDRAAAKREIAKTLAGKEA